MVKNDSVKWSIETDDNLLYTVRPLLNTAWHVIRN